MLVNLGMQEMHRQIQNRFRITSESAVGKLLLMSASVTARPPGRTGDAAGPRAHLSVAEGDRMRLDRFQAWDLKENARPLPTSPHVPFPALNLPPPFPHPLPPLVSRSQTCSLFILEGQMVKVGKGRCEDGDGSYKRWG